VTIDLLYGIGNIQASESEILKDPNYAAIMGGVRHQGPISCELRVSIHRNATRLAVTHTSTVQNIYCRLERNKPSSRHSTVTPKK